MSLEEIYQLKLDESELLYSDLIDDKNIEVRQWEGYRWLHLGDNSVQTLMLIGEIDQVILPNIQALLAVLLFCPLSKRLLNLGLGGASLERYLVSKWPKIEIRSVESNKRVIQLAKNYFNLPNSIDVVHDSAEQFLSGHNDIYDIILCDIFVANMQAPCLYENDFYAHISNCMDKTSVLAINILPESEQDIVNVLLPIKNHFDYLYLLEFTDFSNVIIFASGRKLANINELKKRADDLFKTTYLDLRDIPDRLNVLLETV